LQMVGSTKTVGELEQEISTLKAELHRYRSAQQANFREASEQASGAALNAGQIVRLLDSSPVAVGISRAEDGFVLYQSQRCAEMFGVEISEPRNARDYWADLRDRDAFVAAFRRGEALPDRPVEFIRKDGSSFWGLLSWESIHVGNQDCVLFWVYDVNDLKTAERELQQAKDELEVTIVERTRELQLSENNIRTILESLAEGVLVCDAAGILIEFNAAVQPFLPSKLSSGMSLEEALDGAPGKAWIAASSKASLNGSVARLGDHRIEGSDGVKRVLSAVVAPERGGTGRLVFTLRDVTEQHTLEAQARHSARMEALGQLTGGIAHDYNNMLAGILGGAEQIQFDLEGGHDVRLESVDLILKTAKRAAALTSQLLTFSRRPPQAMVPMNLHETVSDALSLLERTVDKRLTIIRRLHAEHSIIVGEAAQLQNVIMNLGLNASHAMPDRGTFEVSSKMVELSAQQCAENSFGSQPGRFIDLRLSDTGKGMDESTMARIFEPFFTTRGVGEGTGLGLSMVYAAMTSHGGSVSVKSEPEQGTEFRLLFPLDEEHRVADSLNRREELVSGLRVLLVEDEPAIRKVLRTLFERANCAVIEAENGRLGIELFEKHGDALDLVVLDAIMPQVSGGECLRVIRRKSPDLPVLMVSGYMEEQATADVEGLGVNAFLHKPFGADGLARAVRRAIGKA